MINELLVAATAWSLESILQDRDVPYELRDDEEYQYFLKIPAYQMDKDYELDKILTSTFLRLSTRTSNHDAEAFSSYTLRIPEGEALRTENIQVYGIKKNSRYIHASIGRGEIYISSAYADKGGKQDEKVAYLFTYFNGNAPWQEQICYALSDDGYNYTPLNDGKPVINSDTIAFTQCVRDPHILRCEDGKTFYMVVTDMRSELGWSSNRGMVLLKSFVCFTVKEWESP